MEKLEWLPDGEKILKICSFVLTECTNVTDTHTDRQTDTHRMTAQAALAQHRAAKIGQYLPNLYSNE